MTWHLIKNNLVVNFMDDLILQNGDNSIININLWSYAWWKWLAPNNLLSSSQEWHLDDDIENDSRIPCTSKFSMKQMIN